MAASNILIANMTTVITNGPSTTTIANAIAPAGYIMDYVGNCNLVLTKFKEAVRLLTSIVSDTDATDSTNLGLLNGLIAVLNGTSSPSTQAITDIGTVITNGPNTATTAKAIAPAGYIMDYVGNCNLVRTKFKEAARLLTSIVSDTDTGTDSANKTLMQNIQLTLV